MDNLGLVLSPNEEYLSIWHEYSIVFEMSGNSNFVEKCHLFYIYIFCSCQRGVHNISSLPCFFINVTSVNNGFYTSNILVFVLVSVFNNTCLLVVVLRDHHLNTSWQYWILQTIDVVFVILSTFNMLFPNMCTFQNEGHECYIRASLILGQ